MNYPKPIYLQCKRMNKFNKVPIIRLNFHFQEKVFQSSIKFEIHGNKFKILKNV